MLRTRRDARLEDLPGERQVAYLRRGWLRRGCRCLFRKLDYCRHNVTLLPSMDNYGTKRTDVKSIYGSLLKPVAL
jgi:hypothetical protein